MKKTESGIKFEFKDEFSVEKFDETSFYRQSFNKLPNSKGVDFIAKNSEIILLMEVKNCRGNESDNRWRIATNNKKVSTAPTSVDTEGRVSIDIELAQKIAMTLACLVGANSKSIYQKSDTLKPYAEMISSLDISIEKKKIKVVLFLEGDFSSRTRSEKMIMKDLKDSIKEKLDWLNCRILVENINTHVKDIYSANIV